MSTMIAGIIIIIFALLIFGVYSYTQNQKSATGIQLYQGFRNTYQGIGTTAMGYARDNAFTKDVTMFVAADEEGRVIDAKMVVENEMEVSTKNCDEYLGMDLVKYVQKLNETAKNVYESHDPKKPKERAFDMAARKIVEKE